jgi:hypothetical protein
MPRPTLATLPPAPPGRSGWPWTEACPPPAGEWADDDWPAVGIVTPSFQQGEFIEETIRSVLLQGYPRLSYVVMDGGSTDASVAIIRRYAPWLASWSSGPDGGQARAIHRGFELAAGEVLAWVNSDDVLAPGAVAHAANAFRRHPAAAVIYGAADEIARDGARLRAATHVRQADRHALVHEGNAIGQPAAFFTRRAYAAAGGLNPDLHWSLDYDLWIRLAEHGPLVYIGETLASMRIYPEAKTSQGSPAMFDEFRRVGERYGGFGLLNQMIKWLAPGLLQQATAALEAGDTARAQVWLPVLMANDPGWRSERRWAEHLAGIAVERVAAARETWPEAAQWIRRVCRALPPALLRPRRVERRALGLLHEALAFRSFRQQQRPAVLRHAARAIAQDPHRAGNRGLWSIVARSLFRGRQS